MMSRQISPSTEQLHGLQRVTRIWGVSRATVHRHRRPAAAVAHKRPGPLGAMADEDLVEATRQLLRDSPFHGEGHRKLDRGAIKGLQGRSHQPSPCAAGDARARSLGPPTHGGAARLEGPRRHDHHRAGGCHVGQRPARW